MSYNFANSYNNENNNNNKLMLLFLLEILIKQSSNIKKAKVDWSIEQN